ncbi:shikimate dehydrogenase [Croceicoccus naphthovorans]|uniref:Shikimate dehydrogenase (NADP(+)) n=1 Tax=Croceicoccus naphthovorans TaxID=1348774 RepID=A0A0G3XI08_9SPHN|nr:shikimate dehydrogenase [Croceicoccus naphthovorans]AKM11185.1 shikimate dehydrogenase [Croceicoccus naphthovorans]MBB3989923.1 shikimate dehydrogenase [Croceicoccus naphthovorans]
MSKPYAEVIGDPIAHSKSPDIHGFWLKQAGIDADYRHCHVRPEELADYIAKRRTDPDWRGCNVTMPHKQAVMALVDRIDPVAARIGAVNTVVVENGGLAGYNTDAAGFLEPLQVELAKTHYFRMARIIGTGGAARAIITALTDEGVVLVVAGRDPDKARALLDELDPDGEHHVAPLSHFAEATDFAFDDREGCFDLIINATSLGMAGQAPLNFDFSHVPPGSICYDIVTAPLETPFLAEAKARGFRTVDGLSMLIGQAAAAFERFFGLPAPRDADGELRRILTS